jgi:hypothetical protein
MTATACVMAIEHVQIIKGGARLAELLRRLWPG